MVVDEKEWCPYHGLMIDQDGYPTTKAEWGEAELLKFTTEINAQHRKSLAEQTPLDFTGVIFPRVLPFFKTKWLEVSFYRAQFLGGAWFENHTFEKRACFEEARFEKVTNFERATFSESTTFARALFTNEAVFSESNFGNFIAFSGATFKEKAAFEKATFSRDAWFYGATFSGDAGFDKATFKERTYFHSSGRNHTAEEIQANSFSNFSFQDVKFKQTVSFVNRQFLQPAYFENCTFDLAPKFHGCALHEGTIFPPRKNFKDVRSLHAADAYRTLKRAMGERGARHEEAKFYALEQESLRALPTTPWSQKFVSHLYQWTADYGESFLRPIGWLALITWVWFVIYLLVVEFFMGSLTSFTESFYCTLEQLVRPLSVWLPSGGVALKKQLGNQFFPMLIVQLLATIQSIASVSLITLFLLALRRRFKLG